jgi:hypothetical protein
MLQILFEHETLKYNHFPVFWCKAWLILCVSVYILKFDLFWVNLSPTSSFMTYNLIFFHVEQELEIYEEVLFQIQSPEFSYFFIYLNVYFNSYFFTYL